MIRGRSVLGLIPARGGSKRLPRKNVREVAGKPLVVWAIEAGQRSAYIDRLAVSTEDLEIWQICFDRCAMIRRPYSLAMDDTSSEAVARHALSLCPEFDYIVLLQPTSPLRMTEDIDGTIRECDRLGVDTCATVCADTLPKRYNGAVYVARAAHIRAHGRFINMNTVGYAMPPSRSIDIDHETDIIVANQRLRAYHNIPSEMV